LIILTLFVIIPFRVNGQEVVYVHLDKLVYVTGESIRYKVYTVDAAKPGQKPCSKILYFTLTGTNDKNGVNWRINLEDKPVSGYFLIPADIKSGIYVLNAYTNWMRNGPADSFFSQKLLIMNLSETTPATMMIPGTGDTAKVHPATSVNHEYALRLRTSKSSYTVNEKVKLEIDLESEHQNAGSADLSISVSAETPFKDLLEEKDIVSCLPINSESEDRSKISRTPDDHTGSKKYETGIVPCLYRMEDKGFILTGWIKSRKDNSPLAEGKILLAVTDSISPRIIYTATDSDGEFVFYLSKMYDNKELILQLENKSKGADYYWELDKKTGSAGHREYNSYLLRTNETDFLNTAKNIRLVDAIYAKKHLQNQQEAVLTASNYFSPPDMVIYPGDYMDLVNFKEIADNIIPLVKFSIRNNDFNLQVFNNRTSVWNENNMVLLNGIPFTDLAYISTLGTKDIKRIEIITSNFFVGDLTFPGLVSVYTYDNKVPEIYIKNKTFSYKNTVMTDGTAGENLASENAGILGEHYPDFRNTLYWKPDVTVTNKNIWVVEFPVSMLTGKFTINVEGLTTEGYPVSGTTSFEVK